MFRVIELEDKSLLMVKAGPDTDSAVEAGRITAIVSSPNEDSQGDIVHQTKNKRGRGWVYDHFNRSPLVTWQHETHVPNLSAPETRAVIVEHPKFGKVLGLDPVVFDLQDPFAATIDGKLRRRVLKEWSVGFKAKVYDPRRGDSGDRTGGYEIFESHLVENAVCNRGANMDTETALKSMLGRGRLASEAQAGGSAEAEELKADVQALAHQMAQMQKMVADLIEGVSAKVERIDLARVEKAARLAEQIEEREQKRIAAIDGLAKALCGAGTAHP